MKLYAPTNKMATETNNYFPLKKMIQEVFERRKKKKYLFMGKNLLVQANNLLVI